MKKITRLICLLMGMMLLFSSITPVFAENTSSSANILENSKLFAEDSICIKVGEEYQLQYTFDNIQNCTVELDSANEDVVSVKEGKIIGLSEGKTKVYLTVFTDSGRYTDVCLASVLKAGKENSDSTGLFSASVSGQNLYNEYISIVADSCNFSLGTTNGNAYSVDDDNERLLFGWDGSGTSYATIVVDGSAEQYYASPTFDTSNQTIWGTMQKNGVTITRKLSIIKSPSNGRDDIAEITYIATNNDTSSHQVGGRIGLDTMLGDNDHSPFQIQGIGAVTTQMQFVGEQIPQYWQSFDSLTSSSVSSYGTLYTNTMEKPDKVQFGNWGNLLSGSIWEASQSLGSSNGDSAVAITWYPETLLPGQSRTFTTYYGLSAAETASEYTVKFDLNGGTGNCPDQIVSRNSFVIPPEKPTKSGYIFTGWYANKSCTGDPYITNTGVAKRKITANVTLYAGWTDANSIVWGKDTYKFVNTNLFFGATDYKISDEYYNILVKDLNWVQKLSMKMERKSEGGSCYGMTTVLSLVKAGYLSPEYFQSGAKNVYDFAYPRDSDKIRSLINYYQLSQNLPEYYKKVFSNYNNVYLIREIRNSLYNTDQPLIINYEFYGSDEVTGKYKWMGHSVVGYKLTVNDDDPVGLGYKLYIADPNYMLKNTGERNPDEPGPIYADGEPRFMYISSNFDDISYGSYSSENKTMRLKSVFSDMSMFEDINIQKRLNQASLYAVDSATLMSSSEKVILTTNYTNFSILSDDNTSATVTETGIDGDFAIDEPYNSIDGDAVNYNINEIGEYTISVNDDELEEYVTNLLYDAENGCYIETASVEKPDMILDIEGKVSLITENSTKKKVAISAQTQDVSWIGLSIETDAKDITLVNNEDGTVSVSSSETLAGTVVTAISENMDTSVVVEEDVNSFTIEAAEHTDGDYIIITGLSQTIEKEIEFSVVFVSNGGSLVDSIYNISHGSTIPEPTAPTYEGFIFDGWYVDEALATKWDFETDVVTDNLILYAKWEEDPAYYHLVTFYDGEETSQIVVKDGDSLTTDDYPELVEKEGYYSEWQTIDLTNITEDINIYSMRVPTEQVISATLNNWYYENGMLVGSLDYRSYIDGLAQVVITDGNNTIEETVDISIPRGEGTQRIEIPFEADYEYHNICIDFYDNLEEKNVVGTAIKESFYAGVVNYCDNWSYILSDDNTAAIVGYSNWTENLSIPFEVDGYEVTAVYNFAFDNSEELVSIFIPDTVVSIGENVLQNCTNLGTIYYNGDADKWNSIDIHTSNTIIENIDIIYDCVIAVDSEETYLEYENSKFIMDFKANHISDDCTLYAEIYDFDDSVIGTENDPLVLNKTYSCEVSKDTVIDNNNYITAEIFFAPDNKEHFVQIFFVDNEEEKNYVGQPMYYWFYAENEPSYSNGFYYSPIDENTAEIVRYEYNNYDLRIPSYLDGYRITKIADSAFGYNEFEIILIPDTITEIGNSAFESFEHLRTVNYTGTEEQWAAINVGENNDALFNAEKVFEYEPEVYGGFNGVSFSGTSVEGALWFDCLYKSCVAIIEIKDYNGEVEKTLELEIPAGTEEKEFSIPFEADDREHEIYVSFVNNATEMEAVGEGSSGSFYAERANYEDSNFEYVIASEGAEIVRYYGYDTELVIPDTLGGYPVTRIGDEAFTYRNLTAVAIPNTVTYIGEYAFCDNEITEMILPESLIHIGVGAFAGTALTSITIPASVAEIEKFAFDYCHNLESITVDENNQNYSSDDGNLYNKDKTELVRYALGKTAAQWTILDTVTTIKAGALTDSEYLTNVTLTNSVTSIEEYAFAYGAWETLTIPASVTNIDNAAFIFCENLTEINIDSSNENYCSDNGVLFNKNKTILLQYPTGKTNTFYKLPDSVNTISQESFVGCSLQTIVLPTSLETVEVWAFEECRNLNTVLYEGTEDEYWEIDFTHGNDVLKNANITFGYDGMPASIKSVSCWYDSGKVTAKVKFNYLEQAGMLYLAIYDGEKLVTMKDKSVAIDDMENTIEIIDADDNYKDYDVKVFYWEGDSSLKPLAKSVEAEIAEAVLIDTVLESEHPYTDNIDETKTYVHDGECASIDVTFSDDTMTESGYDYIYIYDVNDNEIGEYCGTQLAGQTINVSGNTVKIRLTSDASYAEYGYRTESIIVNK